MLTRADIDCSIELGDIEWQGGFRGDSLILELGSTLQLVTGTEAAVVDLADQDAIDLLYPPAVAGWGSCVVKPGQLVLVSCANRLRLGSGLVGMMATLSHLSRVGLGAHISSPFVLPGWDGHLTFEIHNLGPGSVRIYEGMPVGRVVLFEVHGSTRDNEPHRFYGDPARLGSQYAREFGEDIRS